MQPSIIFIPIWSCTLFAGLLCAIAIENLPSTDTPTISNETETPLPPASITATNTNQTLSKPPKNKECDVGDIAICFRDYDEPTFSKADAVYFSETELARAAQQTRARSPWVFTGSKMQFSISDYDLLAAGVICTRFIIRDFYTASEQVYSTRFDVYRRYFPEICNREGIERIGDGYFGGSLAPVS